jgi:hypothetical protein
LSDLSKVDRDSKFEGRQMVALLSPEKGKKHDENAQPDEKKGT